MVNADYALVFQSGDSGVGRFRFRRLIDRSRVLRERLAVARALCRGLSHRWRRIDRKPDLFLDLRAY